MKQAKIETALSGQNQKERCVVLAEYIVDTGDTVRGAAKRFGVSKSTVHNDITHRLRQVNLGLYGLVRDVLEHNKEERHIRGGDATRRKYALLRQQEQENLSKSDNQQK